jgi:hypothetical protein
MNYTAVMFCQTNRVKKNLKLASEYLKYLSDVERLNKERFTKYYCKKYAKEYSGSPATVQIKSYEEMLSLMKGIR